MDVTNFLEKLPSILNKYEENCIYNADETGLLYRALSTKTMTLKGEKCAGGKMSKERLTILHRANLAGEKGKLLVVLVIGKAFKPRCFGNLQHDQLPVDWQHNNKAWMTQEIMNNWLQQLEIK